MAAEAGGGGRGGGPERAAAGWYLAYFGALGTLLPFLAAGLREWGGFGEARVGGLLALQRWLTVLASPAACWLADATGGHRAVLAGCFAVSVGSHALLWRARTPGQLAALTLLDGLFSTQVSSIADALHITVLGAAGFGRVRLWGAVGWGSAAGLTGLLARQAGVGLRAVIPANVLVSAVASVAACRLPFGARKGERGAADGGTGGGTSFAAVRRLVAVPELVALYGLAVVTGSSTGVIDTFLGLYLQDLGGGSLILGVIMTCMCLGEIPVFFFAGRLIDRLGCVGVIHLAMLSYVVRLLLYFFLQWTPSVWLVLPVELLHGFTFGGLWAASTEHLSRIAKREGHTPLLTTSVATFQCIHFGLGFGVGAFAGGVVYQRWSAATLFLLWAAVAAVGWGLFTLALRAIGKGAAGDAREDPEVAGDEGELELRGLLHEGAEDAEDEGGGGSAGDGSLAGKAGEGGRPRRRSRDHTGEHD